MDDRSLRRISSSTNANASTTSRSKRRYLLYIIESTAKAGAIYFGIIRNKDQANVGAKEFKGLWENVNLGVFEIQEKLDFFLTSITVYFQIIFFDLSTPKFECLRKRIFVDVEIWFILSIQLIIYFYFWWSFNLNFSTSLFCCWFGPGFLKH